MLRFRAISSFTEISHVRQDPKTIQAVREDPRAVAEPTAVSFNGLKYKKAIDL